MGSKSRLVPDPSVSVGDIMKAVSAVTRQLGCSDMLKLLHSKQKDDVEERARRGMVGQCQCIHVMRETVPGTLKWRPVKQKAAASLDEDSEH